MTNPIYFHPVPPGAVDAPVGPDDTECGCQNPDDQYLLEIDAGSVVLIHQACGKQMRGDYLDLVELPRIPVTVKAEPYGNCDGSQWHGEHQCDCGVVLVATVKPRRELGTDRSVEPISDNFPEGAAIVRLKEALSQFRAQGQQNPLADDLDTAIRFVEFTRGDIRQLRQAWAAMSVCLVKQDRGERLSDKDLEGIPGAHQRLLRKRDAHLGGGE